MEIHENNEYTYIHWVLPRVLTIEFWSYITELILTPFNIIIIMIILHNNAY